MMNILHFRGGLGNQLFEYAFYRYWKGKGANGLYLDASYPSMCRKYGFCLREMFPEVAKDTAFLPRYIARPFFLAGDVLKKIGINLTAKEPRQLPVKSKIWVRGIFQRYDYLQEMDDELRRLFTFIPFSDTRNLAVAGRIETSNSVSIHIRRGSYTKPRQRIVYGDICSPDYYCEAIAKVREEVENPKFFIFSNDPEWVRQELNIPDAEQIDWNRGNDSFRDMQLMSFCKHNIIANSSFSWWAAWLNENEAKRVYAPAKWHHNHPASLTDELLPPAWRRIGRVRPYATLVLEKEPSDKALSWLLKQRYADFEITYPHALPSSERKIAVSPNGIHELTITERELEKFKDKKYLQKRLQLLFI